MEILGFPIDSHGRCKHYHGEQDIVSIKFKCCNKYFPCYKCHDEYSNHERKLWKKENLNEKAIICGVCSKKISIKEYILQQKCDKCNAKFHPNCKNHYDKYFNLSVKDLISCTNQK